MTTAWWMETEGDGLAQLNEDQRLGAEGQAFVSNLLGELATLRQTFVDNLMHATADFHRHCDDAGSLAGLSEPAVARAREQASLRQLSGYALTVDPPSFEPALQQLEDRGLRKQLFEARYTLASDRGPRAGRHDNGPVLKQMLELRHALARALGFDNYAELALRHSVYTDPDSAEAYLLRAHHDNRARAQTELDQLWAFAKEKGVPRGFSNWDLSFYDSWQSRETHGFDEASVEQYFPLERVLGGLWTLCERLLSIRVAPAPAAGAQTSLHRLSDASDAEVGQLSLSPYAVPCELHGTQLRVAMKGTTPVLEMRFGLAAPPVGRPTLLTYPQVRALFESVGRGLALLLLDGGRPTDARRRHDAVLTARVVGAYFRHFSEHTDTVLSFARQYETGAPLPAALFSDLLEARARSAHLRAALSLELLLFDLRVHRDFVPAEKNTQLRDQVLDTFMQVRREQSVLPLPYWTRVANSCLPLFAGDEAGRLWQRAWADRNAKQLFEAACTEELAPAYLARIGAAMVRPGATPLNERLTQLLGRPADHTG